MDEEFETIELEYSEEDILYYLVDEDENEIGFVLEIDGEEVECYYEDVDSDEYEFAEGEFEFVDEDGSEQIGLADLIDFADGEVIEMEIDEDAIDRYLFDEDGNEIGFVIIEDGVEVECYYETEEDDDDDEDDDEGSGEISELEAALDAGLEEARKLEPKKAEDHGYLYKMASIAGFKGNQARKKAEAQIDKVRDKAEVGVDKATEVVEAQGEKLKTRGQKLKGKAVDNDLGITREGIKETTADLNAIAKEGAETAKELKEAYDEIMDSFGFLVPKKIRRRMP